MVDLSHAAPFPRSTQPPSGVQNGRLEVISDRPCVLNPVKIKGPPHAVEAEGCTACQMRMNLGCPAITWTDDLFDGHRKVKIDADTCIGCTLCAHICPTDCIRPRVQ